MLERLSGKAKLKDVSLLKWLKQMAVRKGFDFAQQVGIPIAVAETDAINELWVYLVNVIEFEILNFNSKFALIF